MISKLINSLVPAHFKDKEIQVNNYCWYHNWKGQIVFIFFISVFFLIQCFDKKYLLFLIMDCSKVCLYKIVGAVVSTLISFSDGLGQFIFRWKMEKTRPLRYIMDGKGVYFLPGRHFFFDVWRWKYFPCLYLLGVQTFSFPAKKHL